MRSLITSLSSRVPTGRTLLLFLALFFCGVTNGDSVKVAFIGDQSVGDNARSVLQLIADEGTDLLLIQGDLGYGRNAASQWEENLNNALGPDFPVLIVVGNHENFEWPLYQALSKRRINRIGDLSCSGNIGVKSFCQYDNIDIVYVSPGIYEVDGVSGDDNYEDYIRTSLAGSSDRWRICGWHKNQNALQTGSKGDSTGWDVYEACLDAGAMIAVAHEHAYSRSYLLSNFKNQSIVHRNNDMTLQPGQSFVFVSGLGGREIRPQKRGGDWWASIYTATQGATHGALFCEFGNTVAECYFKAVDGSIPDQFTVRRGSVPQVSRQDEGRGSTNGASAIASANAILASGSGSGYVFSRTDKEEYRWIDNHPAGGLGNIWITRSCADSLGGPSVQGDWGDLDDLAPAMDSIPNPCNSDDVSNARTNTSAGSQGFVFSRTDKDEFRWVERNSSGEMGNIWIDRSCADRLGGTATSGDWGDLVDLAPAMDTVANPCIEPELTASPADATALSGYVFSRTDKEEYRWVGQDSAGLMGNVWIDRSCAERLGGASIAGSWKDLHSVAPRFDAIPNPCN